MSCMCMYSTCTVHDALHVHIHVHTVLTFFLLFLSFQSSTLSPTRSSTPLVLLNSSLAIAGNCLIVPHLNACLKYNVYLVHSGQTASPRHLLWWPCPLHRQIAVDQEKVHTQHTHTHTHTHAPTCTHTYIYTWKGTNSYCLFLLIFYMTCYPC